jgi:hypothetical protein
LLLVYGTRDRENNLSLNLAATNHKASVLPGGSG